MIPLIRIFLSSPGDVSAERGKVYKIVEDLKKDAAYQGIAELEIVAWDDPDSDVLMPATLAPQEAIDLGLPRPSQCEIVITLFWGRIGSQLNEKYKKPDGTPYWSGTEWEYLDAVRGYNENKTGFPIIYVYRRTDETPDPKPRTGKSKAQTLIEHGTQLQRVDDFFAQFHEAKTGAFTGYYFGYETVDGFDDLAKKHLRIMINHALKLLTGKDSADKEPLLWDIAKEGSPFPGLKSFDERHEKVYFGRSREVAQVIKRMANQRLQVIVGASGSGKSSLVKAGIFPKLRDNALPPSARWYRIPMRPTDKPFARLAEALTTYVCDMGQSEQTLKNAPDVLHRTLQGTLKDGDEIVLFVDQFEELFTLAPAEAQAFIDLLKFPSPFVRVLITIRSDFYDVLLPYLETELRDSTFTLTSPSQIAMLEMVKRPAEVAGLKFEEGLVEQMIEDVGLDSGALALIAYTLDEMYALTHKRGERLLRFEDYIELGGAQKVIGVRAQQVFSALKLPESVLQRVFHALVAVDERSTRQYARRSQFEGDGEALRLIDAFIDARLLTSDNGQIEVSHEALLREWKTLSNWIEISKEDRSTINRMKREAHIWLDREKPDYLRPNAEMLKEFAEACKRLGVVISDVELLEFTEPEQNRLYRELEQMETTHKRRFDIGERLASIGDSREGVGIKDGLPSMLWLPVTGSKGKIKFKFGEFEIMPFYVSKYLTTYQQYQTFVESGDYDSQRWWHDFPAEYRPCPTSSAANGNANAPIDNISWYQAVAFARWLDTQYRVDEKLQVRLPTEWEWQWMAQNGVEKRAYPWGAWDNLPRTNTAEASLQTRSTAVGMYPQGASVCGALDVSGNLWEWCLNDYDDPKVTNGYGNKLRKVLRGGSFAYRSTEASCTARNHFNPHLLDKDLGLRLVLAPI